MIGTAPRLLKPSRVQGASFNAPAATVPDQNEIALPELKLLLNNRWQPSQSGRTFATINLSTGDGHCQALMCRQARATAKLRSSLNPAPETFLRRTSMSLSSTSSEKHCCTAERQITTWH
jgi:hypothetical protein